MRALIYLRVSGRKTDSGDLPVFLTAKNLKPFISSELADAASSRVLFLPKNTGAARGGGNVVHGDALLTLAGDLSDQCAGIEADAQSAFAALADEMEPYL